MHVQDDTRYHTTQQKWRKEVYLNSLQRKHFEIVIVAVGQLQTHEELIKKQTSKPLRYQVFAFWLLFVYYQILVDEL